MEIDVSKCRLSNGSGDCTSPINKSHTKCEKVPIDWCYFKQAQVKEHALDEIEKFIKSDMCECCKESEDDPCEECNRSCDECNYSIILQIIDEAKGSKNER